jgi:hypothetical protein
VSSTSCALSVTQKSGLVAANNAGCFDADVHRTSMELSAIRPSYHQSPKNLFLMVNVAQNIQPLTTIRVLENP